MKPIYLAVMIISILLIGVVIADVTLTIKDKTATISKEASLWYSSQGIKPTYKDYQDADYYWRCLVSNTNFNLPCSDKFHISIKTCASRNARGTKCLTYTTTPLTDADMETKLDSWMIKTLEGIYNSSLTRSSKSTPTNPRGGNVTIPVIK